MWDCWCNRTGGDGAEGLAVLNGAFELLAGSIHAPAHVLPALLRDVVALLITGRPERGGHHRDQTQGLQLALGPIHRTRTRQLGGGVLR